jgi:hypothetical protein
VAVTDRERRRVTIAAVVASAIMVAYWTAWYADRSLVASETTKRYYDFENAFPVADAWILICLVGGAVTLNRRSPFTLFWFLAGGGAGVYLFWMDVLYDLEHGIWWKNGGGVIELGINVITLAFSIWLMRWAWQRRAALLAGA